MKPSFEDYEALPDVPGPVFHIIRSQDEKFCSGHNRLRLDCDRNAGDLERFQKAIDEHGEQLANVAKRTTDVAQLRFTPGMVVAIVGVCVSIVGGQYLSTMGLREQQATTNAALSLVNAKMDALKQHNEDATRLLDERAAAMADSIKRVETRGEMTDLKVNNLRETVLTTRK